VAVLSADARDAEPIRPSSHFATQCTTPLPDCLGQEFPVRPRGGRTRVW